jgi:hypothetical protein
MHSAFLPSSHVVLTMWMPLQEVPRVKPLRLHVTKLRQEPPISFDAAVETPETVEDDLKKPEVNGH